MKRLELKQIQIIYPIRRNILSEIKFSRYLDETCPNFIPVCKFSRSKHREVYLHGVVYFRDNISPFTEEL